METKRTIIRYFNDQDINQLLIWGQDVIYNQLAGFPMLQNRNQAQQLLDTYNRNKNTFAIEDKISHQCIGLFEINERGFEPEFKNTREIGFLLDKNLWHQGIMTEVLTEMIDYMKDEMKLSEIWAAVYPENINSVKLIEKFDFKYQYTTDYDFLPMLGKKNEKYYRLRIQ